jgi:hypothetical protein
MAVSICFGLLAATILTLLYVPALYLIVQDIIGLFTRKKPAVKPPPLPKDRSVNGELWEGKSRLQAAEVRKQGSDVRGRKTRLRSSSFAVARRSQKTEDR